MTETRWLGDLPDQSLVEVAPCQTTNRDVFVNRDLTNEVVELREQRDCLALKLQALAQWRAEAAARLEEANKAVNKATPKGLLR